MPPARFAVLLAFLAACSSSSDAPVTPVCATCASPTLATRGALPDSLSELSGLVASRAHVGVYWGHDDGASSEVVAFTTAGKSRSRHPLVGAACIDCEDVALVACPAGTCLLLADTGDNDATRAQVALLRFAEPTPGTPAPTAAVDRFPFVYPDGPHDAEAVIADSAGTHAWVVLKQPGRKRAAAVFRVGPLTTPGMQLTAEPYGDLSFPADAGAIAGASVHPCAPIVLLRSGAGLWQLSGIGGATLDTALTAPAVALPVAVELNGEAVAWRTDGAGYVTAGEGKNVPITEGSCR